MYWSFDRVGIVSLYTGCGTTASLEGKRVGVGVTIPLKVMAQSLGTVQNVMCNCVEEQLC